MTRWRAIRVEADEAHAEPLSDALLAAGALSVSIEDADADGADERPLFGEPGSAVAPAWRRNRLVALCDAGADPAALIAAAAAACGIDPVPAFTTAAVEDQDWVRQTQSQFEPIHVGDRLWVVPSWHAPPADTGAVVLRVDPGLAFGTGSHATTRLVLAWLERTGCRGARVLDYGCGSGILGIAAARLGASRVDAVDLDPQAIAAAEANARRNEVALRCFTPDALPDGRYDLVLANILANPLIVLAPLLASRCEAGARLALSGILAPQAAEVTAAYEHAFRLAVAAEEEGWILVEGTRR